jgi:DNA-nicking Smr family endonuclease
MSRRRDTTPEERSLFHSAFSETRPVVRTKSNASASKTSKPGGQLNQRGQGELDGRTSERLRRGLIDPDVRIDLHGLSQSVAHGSLLKFLRLAHKRGHRLALVVTGKGGQPPAKDSAFDLAIGARGVLKSIVPRWLREPEFSSLVVGTKTAHRRHGGDGALYVYLRKVQR